MRSNFHDVLKLVDGVVHAGGPLEWDDGESKAIITVIINQNGVVAGAACSPPILKASETKWSLPVRPALPHTKFKKGPASATSEICAIGEHGEAIPFHWSQTV